MFDKLETAITTLTAKVVEASDSGDAQRLSQAACNIANTMRVLADMPRGAEPRASSAHGLNDTQINHMVDRFLRWRLPENFNPDGGISFMAAFNEHIDHPGKNEPYGTNLFDGSQADAMVRFMLVGMPPTPPPSKND